MNKRCIFTGLPFFIQVGLWVYPPVTNLIQADSQSYLSFHASRTIGYPAFLWLMQQLPSGLELVPPIQLIIYALACGFLLRRLQAGGKLGVALCLAILLMITLHREIRIYHFQIMTESLSLSVLLFLIGIWIDFVQRQKFHDLFKIAALIGLGILLRPSYYAALGLLALGWWMISYRTKQYWRTFSIATGPLLILLFLGSLSNYFTNGVWGTQSFLGHNLIGKVTFILKEDAAPAPLVQAVKPLQDLVQSMPNYQFQHLLKAPYYDVTRYHILPRLFTGQDHNSTWITLSLNAISANFIGYVEDVAWNYGALWFYPQALTHSQAAMFNAIITSKTPLPYLTHYNHTIVGYPAWVLWTVRLCFLSAFLISLYYLVTIFSNPLGGGLSLLIHSNYLLVASLQAGLIRYAVLMWPCIVVLCSLFLKERIQFRWPKLLS